MRVSAPFLVAHVDRQRREWSPPCSDPAGKTETALPVVELPRNCR